MIRNKLGRTIVFAFIFSVLTLALVTANGTTEKKGGAGSGATTSSKTLEWGISSSPDSLFAPTYFNSPIGSGIMGLIYDNLLVYTGDNKLEPSLATSWKATSPTTYVYTIRSDARFSDGSPVTAEDVAFSFQMQTDPKLGSKESFLFENIKSVTTQGQDVTIELKTPDSTWKYIPTHMGAYIVKKSDVLAHYDSYGTPQNLPVGSGPYMVKEFVPDSHVTLVRNPYYWGTPPPFDTIQFDVIPDDQTRLLAMQSGKIDGTFSVPATALTQWSQVADIATAPAFIFRGFTIDMKDSPFDDIHVRRALYYATDRASIVSGLFAGTAQPANALEPPAIFQGQLSDAAVSSGYSGIQTFDFDLAAARKELAQSKVPNGFNMTLNVPTGSQPSIDIAQAIKATWAKIGVNVTLNMMPGGPRFQLILDHGPNLGVQIIGNLPDVPDPATLPFEYFDSSQAVKGGNNSSNLVDPSIDKLLSAAQTETDPAKSAQLVLQAQIEASKEVPIIPVLWSSFEFAIKKGWTMGPINGFSVTHDFVASIVPK